ncbi:4-hydroxy-tetrahydrodipicolinate reductase [Terrimonas sp. NA20]|uniref:4-hydroxy-tetrahydrodipicolinate reductase n=1 Tax=Terrimonas ginsenosidimutans TaxID=2908004 RepID=A0ABS9KTK6_9BACT|nr:4-hydroxy-tetrahydrodipicolinate reductase [Terrimonas ginsenosidimutans]MCG2615667.1 4-hydroxy-tetrahydrodipicolinate reductase [Terrimonas ginsenosidimutans]
MRIALLGYGKMGKAIEEIALQRGHEIVLKVNEENLADFTKDNVSKADVAIEFTNPHSAFDNVKQTLGFGVPVVSGSTGWIERLGEIESFCQQHNGSFLYASNFSVGVNIFFELNKRLASLMAPHTEYEVSMEEIHHTQKKDAPSGTAITLAEHALELLPRKNKWVNDTIPADNELAIISKRIDPAPGTHIVKYTSAIDDIEIIHTAHNRKGFATGAVLAAEFIKDKKGIFSMKEVLGL